MRMERLRIQDEKQQVKLELALRATERTQRALETTVGVAQRLTSILNLERLLNQVAELIQERYGYYYVGIYLVDEAGQNVVSRAGTGEAGRKFCEAGFSLPIGEDSIIGWVAQHHEVALVNNVDEDARYRAVDEVPDTRSELTLPLGVADAFLGVLDIQSDKLWAFNSDDVRVLQALADQVAVAIQNASLYQAERTRRLLVEKLYDVGRALLRTLDRTEVLEMILEQLCDIVPFDRGSVMLEDGDEMVIVASTGFPEASSPTDVRIPIREGDVYYEIRQTQRSVLVPDVSRRADWQYVEDLPPAQSWLGVPLILEEGVIGMLSLTRERPDPYTEDERTLSAAFASQAAIALENARLYDDLSQVNLRLEETVAELEERTEDLEIAYAQLERLDRTKSDFISVASHELRTPLTVLSGYNQILLQDPEIQENAYRHQLVTGIEAGIARLHTIMDSMLDMAKIDSRELQLHPEPVYLAPILQNVRTALAKAYQTRDVDLILEEDLDDLPKLEADADALRKVFYHLIVNGIKYTPDGGSVTVRGRALPPGAQGLPQGGVEIVVSDTGIGIDPNMQELIFAKFYQTGEVALHSSGLTKFKGGGPGLGLAIARGIVEAHGGKIWVESPGYDEEACPGSTFYIALPFTPRVLLDQPAP
jgi:signal transduction histidine kinase